jgi:hypothetical protein
MHSPAKHTQQAANTSAAEHSGRTATAAFTDRRPEAAALSQQIGMIQQKSVSSPVAQRVTDIYTDDHMTDKRKQRWLAAAQKFLDAVVNGSPLAQGQLNQVRLYGQSDPSGHIGFTNLFVGEDGYTGMATDDYDKFTVYSALGDHTDESLKNRALRVVVAVNMPQNPTDQEVYTTLLHEWIAHASQWEKEVNAIRGGGLQDTLKGVRDTGGTVREDAEHLRYANLGRDEIEQSVTSLGLDSKLEGKVLDKVLADQQNYDDSTGKFLGTSYKKKGTKRKEII